MVVFTPGLAVLEVPELTPHVFEFHVSLVLGLGQVVVILLVRLLLLFQPTDLGSSVLQLSLHVHHLQIKKQGLIVKLENYQALLW